MSYKIRIKTTQAIIATNNLAFFAEHEVHLSALEATYIKTLKPILCRQKEFLYSLQISHELEFIQH